MSSSIDHSPPPRLRRLARRFRIPALVLSAAFALPILALGALLETWRGRLVCVPLLAAAILPAALVALASREERRLRDFAPLISILVLQLTSVSAALLVTPTGFVEGPSPLQQVFLPGRRFHRFSAFNLLPELDQVKLGIFLGPALGLLQSREEGRRLGEVLLPLNRAAENRSEYRQMGSVAGWTLAEIWGGAFDAGHLYQYVPPHRSDEHLPVLVVLHGYGGNSKTYPVVFEGFGAGNRFIVLCPSYGFGIYREGWVEAMDRVRSYAVDHLSADPGRIFLLGYSNGGIGAFKAVAAHPEHYAGMILVSAVFRPDLFTPEVRAAWGERPILCLSGGRDTRISPEYSSARIQELRASGLKIAWDAYSDEDHFMLFASREAVVHRISAWLEEEQLK